MNVKTFENFLTEEDHSIIFNTMQEKNFPWGISKVVADENYEYEDIKSNLQFVHLFYNNYAPCSTYGHLVMPIITKINPTAIVRIKANLNLRTKKQIEHAMHTDWKDHDGWTAVYYVNSNDGYTLFEDGTRIQSKENTLVVFDSTLLHTGTTCTDEQYRLVINFNFYGGNI